MTNYIVTRIETAQGQTSRSLERALKNAYRAGLLFVFFLALPFNLLVCSATSPLSCGPCRLLAVFTSSWLHRTYRNLFNGAVLASSSVRFSQLLHQRLQCATVLKVDTLVL